MKLTATHDQQARALSVLGAAILVLFVSAGCLPRSTPAPLPTLRPTPTPMPTATPASTSTPALRPPTPTPTPSYLITTVDIDETIEVGNLIMTVTRIPPVDSAPEPSPGRRFVLLDLTIENAGDRLVGINSARELILKDRSNQIYRITSAAMAATGGTTPDVDVAPGEIVRAQVGFEVPTNANDLELTFVADRFEAGKIFIRLP